MTERVNYSQKAISNRKNEIISLVDQMIKYENPSETRVEVESRARLKQSGVEYIKALDLLLQGNFLPPEDLNNLMTLTADFVTDVNFHLPGLSNNEIDCSLNKRDSEQIAKCDKDVRDWLSFIQTQCLDKGDEYLKQAMVRPLTIRFEGRTSIDVIEELGKIDGISVELLTDSIVLAANRDSE